MATSRKSTRRSALHAAESFAPGDGGLTQEEAFRRLNVQVDLLPVGASNRPGTRIRPTHITIHNTGNADAGADALMHARYMKGPEARAREVSWHFTVDDRMCVKHLPTNEKGWHAGPANSRSVAVEICEHAGIDKAAATDRASLLTAVLMFALDIAPERVVTHQFWTGKDCPRVVLREPGGFEAFRQRVVAYLEQLRAPAAFALAMGPDGAPAAGAAEAAGTSLVDASVMEMAVASPALPSATDATMLMPGDHVAHLERLVGRLTLENQLLRATVAGLQDLVREAE